MAGTVSKAAGNKAAGKKAGSPAKASAAPADDDPIIALKLPAGELSPAMTA